MEKTHASILRQRELEVINLDEQCQKQTEVEKKELFKKAYRTYGQVTYK